LGRSTDHIIDEAIRGCVWVFCEEVLKCDCHRMTLDHWGMWGSGGQQEGLIIHWLYLN
jgi:hypothetical protein